MSPRTASKPEGPASTAVAIREPDKAIIVIRDELEKREEDLLKVLPPGMDAQRFIRVSLLAVSKNPEILACTPGSIIRAIIEAAEIGLEPTGSLNRAWLVGYKDKDKPRPEATLMIGYQGYADLMRDSGKITRITTEVVYDGDYFKVVKGTETPRIEHEPAFASEDVSKITYAYAIAWFGDGGYQSEVMSRAQIEAIRAKSRQRNGPTWTQSWPQMARKTTIRRLANYVPLSSRAQEAIARDDEREYGSAAPTVTVSRTAEVRDRLLNRGKVVVSDEEAAQDAPTAERPTWAKSAPGGPETAEVAPDATGAPAESAGQQTEGSDTVAQVVCGALSDPKLGEVETCVRPPGHLAVEGAIQSHQSAAASVWPA